jgi:hypothetical protein
VSAETASRRSTTITSTYPSSRSVSAAPYVRPDHIRPPAEPPPDDRSDSTRPTPGTPQPTAEEPRGSLAWPEAVAITVLLLAVALLATGWVDPMLPWR